MIIAAAIAASFLILNPVSSDALFRYVYGAIPLTPRVAPGLVATAAELARRAELERAPTLFLIPTSVLQAMAAGLAIAGVDVGDVKPMVGAQNRALIVAKSDANGFAAALKRLLTAPGLRETIGRENQAHVRAQYDQTRMFAAYGDLFEAAMARRRPRRAAEPVHSTRPDDAGRTGVA